MVLMRADVRRVGRWFTKEEISKLIVGLGFLGLAVVIGLFLWAYFWSYFVNLATFEVYGELTAEYLLRATLLLMVWIGVGSGMVTGMSFLFNQNKETDYLVSLPVSSGVMVSWMGLKNILLNLWLVILGVVPIGWAYFSVFVRLGWLNAIVGLGLIVLWVSVVSSAVASLLVYLGANFWKKMGKWSGIGAAVGLFGVSAWGLIKVIFPTDLRLLYQAESESFVKVYQSLPLNVSWLPSNWLSLLVTGGVGLGGLFLLLIMVIVMMLSWWVQKRQFLGVWQKYKEKQPVIEPWMGGGVRGGEVKKLNLVIKDLLSVVRESGELGYGLLLLGMVVVFLVLESGVGGSLVLRDYDANLAAGGMLFLLFFTIAFALRIVFPLMAREGKVSWWFFVLPEGRTSLWVRKLLAGLIMSAPIVILVTLAWWIVPFVEGVRVLLSVVSLLMGIVLVLWYGMWGAVAPSFKQADKPELTSTSLTGMLALAGGLALSVGVSLGVYLVMKGVLSILTFGLQVGVGVILMMVVGWIVAEWGMERYEF